jgi:tetratricopeptide (TPR) repeat protein
MYSPNELQVLHTAVAHHGAGRLAEAEAIYRQVLAHDPRNADVLNLLGMIAGQKGQPQVAVELISRAIELHPEIPLFHQSLGESLRLMGRLDEAIASARRALELDSSFVRAVQTLGNAQFGAERYEEALATGHREVQLTPESALAYHKVGACLHKLERYEEGLKYARRAVELDPRFAEAQSNLGACLQELRRLPEAIAAFRAAIAIKPDYADAHCNLGRALAAEDDFPAAIASHRQALVLDPNSFEAHDQYGHSLLGLNDIDRALAEFRKSIALRPNSAEAHFNLATALLLTGNFSEGWPEYEWRWKKKGFKITGDVPGRPNLGVPEWEGEDLNGRTILVYGEQGIGDALQFVRYVPLLEERGAKVVVLSARETLRVLKLVGGGAIVLEGSPHPKLDFQCAMLSLPRIFRTILGSIPSHTPYLLTDEAQTEIWKQRIEARGNAIKVGLAWAGNPRHENDRRRSIGLERLAPLASVRNVTFYSLQLRPAEAGPLVAPQGMKLIDLTKEISDLTDTAALIANLDLVLSVDSAMAHLTGALGKPVWVLVPFAPDWRWMMERTDSPWYPTMRLYRQPRLGDWETPMKAVVADLQAGNI